MATETMMAVDRQHPAVYVGLRHGVRFACGILAETFAEASEFRGIQRECPQALLQIALPLLVIFMLHRTAGGVVK
jgi:hypothetical protein